MSKPWLGLEGDAEAPPVARDLARLSHHLLRGMVLQRILSPDDRQRRRQFDLFKQLAAPVIGRARTNGERKTS